MITPDNHAFRPDQPGPGWWRGGVPRPSGPGQPWWLALGSEDIVQCILADGTERICGVIQWHGGHRFLYAQPIRTPGGSIRLVEVDWTTVAWWRLI